MATKKVILNGETIMTLEDTTAIESDVAQGKVFYKSNGDRAIGTNIGGGNGDIQTIFEGANKGFDVRNSKLESSMGDFISIPLGSPINANTLATFQLHQEISQVDNSINYTIIDEEHNINNSTSVFTGSESLWMEKDGTIYNSELTTIILDENNNELTFVDAQGENTETYQTYVNTEFIFNSFSSTDYTIEEMCTKLDVLSLTQDDYEKYSTHLKKYTLRFSQYGEIIEPNFIYVANFGIDAGSSERFVRTGYTKQLNPTISKQTANLYNEVASYTWSEFKELGLDYSVLSSDETVATVDSDTLVVTGLSEGPVEIAIAITNESGDINSSGVNLLVDNRDIRTMHFAANALQDVVFVQVQTFEDWITAGEFNIIPSGSFVISSGKVYLSMQVGENTFQNILIPNALPNDLISDEKLYFIAYDDFLFGEGAPEYDANEPYFTIGDNVANFNYTVNDTFVDFAQTNANFYVGENDDVNVYYLVPEYMGSMVVVLTDDNGVRMDKTSTISSTIYHLCMWSFGN